MAALVPRRLARSVVWAEWGPVPVQFRAGLPRRAYVFAARRAAWIIAISEGTKRSIADVGVPADKIVVLPNAVDVEAIDFDPEARERLRREWDVGPDTFVASCVSRLHPKKRLDVLVESLASLDGDVLLVLAGDGEEKERLRLLAAPYAEKVRFVPTPRGYIWEIMSAGDIALFSPAPTEGSPIVVVMAQLARRAVVATGPEGVAGDGGARHGHDRRARARPRRAGEGDRRVPPRPRAPRSRGRAGPGAGGGALRPAPDRGHLRRAVARRRSARMSD